MKQKTGRKLTCVLLALAMIIGLMSGMSLTAWADDAISFTSIFQNMIIDAPGGIAVQNDTDDMSEFGRTSDHPGASTVNYTYVPQGESYMLPPGRYQVIEARIVNKGGWYTFKPLYDYSVTLYPSTSQVVALEHKVSLTAAVEPADAPDKKVKWSVSGAAVKLYSDPSCAEGTEVGTDATETLTVYAKGISVGSATITVTSNADSTKTASSSVAVYRRKSIIPTAFLFADLRLGSQGEDVQSLQERLTDLGFYSGAIDGDFGPVTDAAVKAFQKANELHADGVVGSVTGLMLGYVVPPSSQGQSPAPSTDDSLVIGSTGEAVLALQQALMSLGYNAGALDGYFGPVTETAVKAFQKDNGLYVDGVVGPYTLAALRGADAPTTEPAGKAEAPQTGKDGGDLVYGMTSDEIAYVQMILDILGYNVGAIDGYFGDVTLEAVKAFQRDYGLYVDGVIGAKTKAALGIQ